VTDEHAPCNTFRCDRIEMLGVWVCEGNDTAPGGASAASDQQPESGAGHTRRLKSRGSIEPALSFGKDGEGPAEQWERPRLLMASDEQFVRMKADRG
jgi:hypothetical protein